MEHTAHRGDLHRLLYSPSPQLHNWPRIKWLACPCEHSGFLFLSTPFNNVLRSQWKMPRRPAVSLAKMHTLAFCIMSGKSAVQRGRSAENKGGQAGQAGPGGELWPIFPPTRDIFKPTITLIASEGCIAYIYAGWKSLCLSLNCGRAVLTKTRVFQVGK